jgi:guanylate kinase
MGKSSSGKDTIYKELLRHNPFHLEHFASHTTRPIREGETNGVEYFFDTKEKLEEYRRRGMIIEERVYHTVHGDWYYYTANDGQIDLSTHSYLVIGTLESYLKIQQYYGADAVVPVYLWIDDGIRLERALLRERTQEEPKYAEMCRRYLADEADFSEENLQSAGIDRRFHNQNVDQTGEEIIRYIGETLAG